MLRALLLATIRVPRHIIHGKPACCLVPLSLCTASSISLTSSGISRCLSKCFVNQFPTLCSSFRLCEYVPSSVFSNQLYRTCFCSSVRSDSLVMAESVISALTAQKKKRDIEMSPTARKRDSDIEMSPREVI